MDAGLGRKRVTRRGGSMYSRSTLPRRRKRYPKCTVYAGTDAHPEGCKTVSELFQWPDKFLQKLADHFGIEWLAGRLKSWRWSFSSAFTGIGGCESVLASCSACACPRILRLWQAWQLLQSGSYEKPSLTLTLNLVAKSIQTASGCFATRTPSYAASKTSRSWTPPRSSSAQPTQNFAKSGRPTARSHGEPHLTWNMSSPTFLDPGLRFNAAGPGLNIPFLDRSK